MELRNALNRVSYGVKPEQLKELESLGWEKWVKQQLSLEDDTSCDKMINELQYVLEFEEGGRDKTKELSLFRYYATAQEIFDSVKDYDDPPTYLMQAGAVETALITWTKALHSKNQLYEILVEFWHNHFNVSVYTDDIISALFSIYDRDVIRKNALGNFRQFVEDVAKSPCMLFYLDNAFSKASPANENYARELFELHTLGAMHYYNHLYDDWKHVPGAEKGEAEGYIDEDVYEAARAFTGWTVGTGQTLWDEVEFPGTGAFYYYDQWHDHYQKRVLGKEFKSHQDAMADGQQVLDLVCFHKGTAKHLCTKLCAWLIADEPPESIVNKAIEVWMTNLESDDQLLKVVETILLSEEFEKGLGQKIKRPNHLILSTVRHLDLKVKPTMDWMWVLMQMGWKQFAWPIPTGHPDTANYWLNTDMILKRWNSIPLLLYFNMENGDERHFVKEFKTLSDQSFKGIVDHWSKRILGEPISAELSKQIEDEIYKDMAEIKGKDLSILLDEYEEGLEYKLMQVAAMICLSPEFHKR